MCEEHERQTMTGSSPHPHCGHDPHGDSQLAGAARVPEPDAIQAAAVGDPLANPSAADAAGAM